MVNSLHTKENREYIIATQQDVAGPISDEAKRRNAETVALAVERMRAEKLAASMPDFVAAFNNVADMTPEMERALNEMIVKKGG